MARQRRDWRAIEAEYRAGVAVAVIARAHGLAASTVYARARRDGWRRDGRSAAGSGGEAAGRGEAGIPHGGGRELARLGRLAAQLAERLERVLAENGEDSLLTAGRESPAGLLLKLCQITDKIVVIERRLAGAQVPDPGELEDRDRDILDRFMRRLDRR